MREFGEIFSEAINVPRELCELIGIYCNIDVDLIQTLRLLNKESAAILEYSFINKVICRYPTYDELYQYHKTNERLCILVAFMATDPVESERKVETICAFGETSQSFMSLTGIKGINIYEREHSCKCPTNKHVEYGPSEKQVIIGVGDIYNIIRTRPEYLELYERNRGYVDLTINNYLLSILDEIKDNNLLNSGNVLSNQCNFETILHYYSTVPRITIDLYRKDNNRSFESIDFLSEYISNPKYSNRKLEDKNFHRDPDNLRMNYKKRTFPNNFDYFSRKFFCGIC